MGIFSKLFGRSENKSDSYVRTWVEKKMKNVNNSSAFTPEILFIFMIRGLTGFIQDVNHKYHIEAAECRKRFSGDSSLFEVGCYLLFQMDLWLFKNCKNRRNEIMSTMMDRFIELFKEALTIDVEPIVNERVQQYGKHIRKQVSIEEEIDLLKKLILLTDNNKTPKSYDFDNFGEVYVDPDLNKNVVVTVSLSSWLGAVLPSLESILEKYCK